MVILFQAKMYDDFDFEGTIFSKVKFRMCEYSVFMLFGHVTKYLKIAWKKKNSYVFAIFKCL